MAPVLLAIDGTDATTLGADADLRRTRHLDLGDDEAGRRIQSRKSMPADLRITLRPPSHPTR